MTTDDTPSWYSAPDAEARDPDTLKRIEIAESLGGTLSELSSLAAPKNGTPDAVTSYNHVQE